MLQHRNERGCDRDQQSRKRIRGAWDRLSSLSEASPRINESLEFGTARMEILTTARELTRTHYGGINFFAD